MDWSSRRRTLAITIIVLVALALLAVMAIAIFYRAPTCTDGRQNQDETGVDCGGRCARICTPDAEAARIRFARALTQAGRTDVIVYIENPNREATGTVVPVAIEIFATDGTRFDASATAYLPPASVVPVLVLNAAPPGTAVRQTFARTGTTTWVRGAVSMPLPTVASIETTDAATSPRVTAVLENTSAVPQYRVPVLATVFDADGVAIAASRTIVELVPPLGTAPARFTWSEPWVGVPARIEIAPVPGPAAGASRAP